MSTASTRSTRRSRSRTALAAGAAAALVAGLVTAATVPANALAPAAVDPACVNSDVSTAVLTSVAVSPATVDVRTGAKKVTVTIAASDSRAITRVTVTAAHGRQGVVLGAELTRVAGTAQDGTWRGTIVVPRGAVPGTWAVESVSLWNGSTRSVTYGPASAGWGTWPDSFTVRSKADTTGPTLRSFSTSTRAVTTTTRAKEVTFRVRMTDAQAGVSFVVVRAVRDLRTGRLVDTELRRSTKPGVWVGTGAIPAYVGKGTHTWRLRVITADRVGNRRSWSSAALASRGFPSTLRVTSRTDRTRPALTGFTFSPTTVDARTGEQKVEFAIQVTDAKSGPGGAALSFVGPGPRLNAMTITSVVGTAHRATFSGYVVVPQCGATGTYLASVLIADAAGNVWDGPPATLASRGFATELAVQQLPAAP